ncbi:MAG: M29 family metallopeptidase [Anaerolineae bacterium]
MNDDLTRNAVWNLLARLGSPVRAPVVIICSEGKERLGFGLMAALVTQGMAFDLLVLKQKPLHSDLARASALARSAADSGSLVLLIEPEHAAWLFATVGRPDTGLLVPDEHLYCDWLLGYPGLLRILQADYAALIAWRSVLLGALAGVHTVRLTSSAGTDLMFEVSPWQAMDGEVCAAVRPAEVSGTLAVDGFLYGGPPRQPFVLELRDGRIANLDSLDLSDPQQSMLYADLTRDADAGLVAELGLGHNPCARPDADIMEAEMARGTAHVGFGESRFLGGTTASATHVDVGLLQPTLAVDGRAICAAGIYRV